MMFIIVDLPEPDVPMIAIDAPCSIVRSTPRSAWTRLSPITYVRSIPRISISGGSPHQNGSDLARLGAGRQALDLGDQLVAGLEVALDAAGSSSRR